MDAIKVVGKRHKLGIEKERIDNLACVVAPTSHVVSFLEIAPPTHELPITLKTINVNLVCMAYNTSFASSHLQGYVDARMMFHVVGALRLPCFSIAKKLLA